MKVVVDANIVISCLIKHDGHVAELFLNSDPPLEIVAPEFLIAELTKHRQ